MQRDLERFRIPPSLVGKPGCHGLVPKRLGRVFVDRTDLPAGHDLTQELRSALARSRHLVVLCSNAAADPGSWVNREIAAYREVREQARVLAVIVRDKPPECFPSELVRRDSTDGDPVQPLAADMRAEGDGPRIALSKLVAGILGVDFDTLHMQRVRTERRRRRVLVTAIATYALVISAALIGVTFMARDLTTSRNEAIADRARLANDVGRTDLSLLLAATALPAKESFFERRLPSAEAQAVRAMLSPIVEQVVPVGNTTLAAWDARRERLYFSGYGGRVSALDIGTLKPVALPVRIDDATALAISADGRLLAITTTDGRLLVVTLQDGQVASTPGFNKRVGRSVAISPDGSHIAVGFDDGHTAIWSLETRAWTEGPMPSRGKWMASVAYSLDGKRVLSSDNVAVVEWDARNPKNSVTRGVFGSVAAIRALHSGYWAVTAVGAPVHLVSMTNATFDRVVGPARGAVEADLAGDDRLVTASWEPSSAAIIDPSSGEVLVTLSHPEWVDHAFGLPDRGRVLTLARDGLLRVWRDPLSGRSSRRATTVAAGSNVLVRTADHRALLGGPDGTILELVDVQDTPFATIPCPQSTDRSGCGINVLLPTPDTRQLAYALADGRIGRIDLADGKVVWERKLSIPAIAMTIDPHTTRATLLLENGTRTSARLDDDAGQLQEGPSLDPKNQISYAYLGFDPAGTRLAIIDRNGLRVESADDPTSGWVAPIYDRIAMSAAWTSNGKRIVVGTAGGTVQVFAESGGAALKVLRGHTSWVTGIAVAPSGRYAASLSNRELLFWDLEAGQIVKTVRGPELGGFTALLFARDGRSVIAADSAGGIWTVPFDVPPLPSVESVCARIPAGARRYTDGQMRELAFLTSLDRAPCNRPGLWSIRRLSTWLTGTR